MLIGDLLTDSVYSDLASRSEFINLVAKLVPSDLHRH